MSPWDGQTDVFPPFLTGLPPLAQDVRPQRRPAAAAVADRADRQRALPGAHLGERGEEHVPHPLEARREAGLQPGGGCLHLQGRACPKLLTSFLLKTLV